MSRILFVQNLWVEWYGVMTLAGVVRARGHDCAVVIGGPAAILRECDRFHPDALGFPAMTIQHQWIIATARELRRRGCTLPIIVGGSHPTFFPDLLEEPAIDFLCRGDGEEPLAGWLDRRRDGAPYSDLPNFSYRRDGVPVHNPIRYRCADLDRLPPAARDLYDRYRYFRNRPYEIFMAARGCPYSCSFCFSHAERRLTGADAAPVRRRSVSHLLTEIEAVRDRRPIRMVLFLDSTFNLDRDWLLAFAESYRRRINLPYSCNLRWDLLDDGVAAALAASGCANVRVAVESGSDRLRNGLLRKGITDEQIRAGRRRLAAHGIPLITFNMMGLPTETLDEARATIRLNRELAPRAAIFDLFLPVPGLAITAEAIRLGVLRPGDLPRLGQSPYRVFESILEQPEIRAVANLQKFAVLAVYCPRLEPLLNRLLHFPPNPLFRLVCGLGYLAMFRRWSRTGWGRILREALANLRALG